MVHNWENCVLVHALISTSYIASTCTYHVFVLINYMVSTCTCHVIEFLSPYCHVLNMFLYLVRTGVMTSTKRNFVLNFDFSFSRYFGYLTWKTLIKNEIINKFRLFSAILLFSKNGSMTDFYNFFFHFQSSINMRIII